jgi:hypothetical protein
MLLLTNRFRIPLVLSLLLVLVACGQDPKVNYNTSTYTPPAHLYIDPELKPHLDAYIADAAAAGVPVPEAKLQEFQGLMWTDHVNIQAAPDATLLGHCQRRSGLRFVEILRPNSEGKAGTTLVDDITLKVMVYHELGHCLHDFSGHTSGRSAAVMNTYLQPARYFDLDGLLRDHFQMLKKMQDDPSYHP